MKKQEFYQLVEDVFYDVVDKAFWVTSRIVIGGLILGVCTFVAAILVGMYMEGFKCSATLLSALICFLVGYYLMERK